MAVTCVGVGTGQSTSATTVATSAAVTPAANKLYLAVVASRAAASPNAPTVTGCGLTWIQVATRVDATNFRRITVFRAMKASGLSSQVVTASIAPSQTVALISVLELDGVDITGTDGSGAVVTSGQGGSTSAVGGGNALVSNTMAAWGDAVNNAAVSCWWHGNAEATGAKAGWAEPSDQAGTSSMCLETQFKVGQDLTPQCSWAGSAAAWGGIAIEIKGVPAIVYNQTPSGGLVLGGTSALTKAYDYPQSGGLVLGGSCSTALGHGYIDAPSGGIVFSSGSGAFTGGGIDTYTMLDLHFDAPWHPVVAFGNAKLSTAQAKFGSSSAVFDAASRIQTADAPDFDFSGAWTVDLWVNNRNSATASTIITKRADTGHTGPFMIYNFGNGWIYLYMSSAGTWDIANGLIFAESPSNSGWFHLAVVRHPDGSVHCYRNGVERNNLTPTATPWDNTAPIVIGGDTNGAAYDGWIDEVRLSNTARWTSAFTPPTAPYTRDANTQLLLHFEGADGSTNFVDAEAGADSSQYAHSIIPSGGPPVLSTAQSKFGGSSALFDPGSYYSPDSPDWDLGSGDFTVDLWYQPTTLVDCTFIGQANSYAVAANNAWTFGITDYAKSLMFEYNVADGNGFSQCYTTSSFTPVVGTWYHLAVVRSGTSLKMYVNGVQSGPTYTLSAGAFFNSSEPLLIGSRTIDGQWSWIRGYLDEVRISKGIARWTSDFTPPTAPYSVPVGVPGSSVALTIGFDPAPSGGLILNGSVVTDYQTTRIYNDAPSGGIVLGGSAATTRALALAQTGGIVLGGSAATTRAVSYTPATAGIVLGGSAAITLARAATASGGIVLGGSAAITWVRDTAQSGGIVLNGTCSSSQTTSGNYTDTPAGGIVLGGSASSARDFSKTPSGGIVLGGSAVTVLQLPGPTYTVTPSGGIVLGGSAVTAIAIAISVSPSGGVVLNGSCSTQLFPPGPIYNNSPTGGIQLDGTVTISQIKSYTDFPAGGIVLGGTPGTAGETIALPPISDRTDGGWTDQAGGQELWAAIDEVGTPDDADYIKSSTAPLAADICEVAFASAIDPQSSTGHTLTYRYGSEAGGWTTVVQNLTPAQADAITSYGTLGIRFEAKV